MNAGRVEAIFLAQPVEGDRVRVSEVRAFAGQGLDGDAYRAGGSRERDRETSQRRGRDLTLIEAEAIEALAAEAGIELEQYEPRRNVVTRGIGLNDLVGKRFRVGEVECLGRLLCEPCTHLEGLTQPGVLRGLVHRGGLRADVLSDGLVRVGDEVAATA